MTASRVKISPAYEEWDLLQEAKLVVWGRVKKGMKEVEIHTVDGERAYPVDKAGSHPSDGYPCRVEVVGRE